MLLWQSFYPGVEDAHEDKVGRSPLAQAVVAIPLHYLSPWRPTLLAMECLAEENDGRKRLPVSEPNFYATVSVQFDSARVPRFLPALHFIFIMDLTQQWRCTLLEVSERGRPFHASYTKLKVRVCGQTTACVWEGLDAEKFKRQRLRRPVHITAELDDDDKNIDNSEKDELAAAEPVGDDDDEAALYDELLQGWHEMAAASAALTPDSTASDSSSSSDSDQDNATKALESGVNAGEGGAASSSHESSALPGAPAAPVAEVHRVHREESHYWGRFYIGCRHEKNETKAWFTTCRYHDTRERT
eukprot:6486817-Amphidinium_carterae.1